MHLRLLKLRSFRNYSDLNLAPASGLNILIGSNAQGKSNLLEAIYLLATTRSIRASRESEMIRHGLDAAGVGVELVRESQGDVDLEMAIYQSEKKIVKINGVKRPRVLDLLGNLNAVHFGALDLGIASGEPALRRRYLNIEISQISPKYCYDLSGYRKVLEQRNRLLRELRERPNRNSGIEAWNDQLVHYGAPLFEKRRFFLDRLAPIADEIHRELTDGLESLTIRYAPSVPLNGSGSNEIAEAFRSELDRVAGEERRRGSTLVGPQRDDIQLLINDLDARSFGSQGQQRTVVLSLKLAQFRLMEDYIGEPPIMLLDDVMSDLDDKRRSHLMTWIRRRCQTFITCTSLQGFPQETLNGAALYHVNQAVVTESVRAESNLSDESARVDKKSKGKRIAPEIMTVVSESKPDRKSRKAKPTMSQVA